MGDPECQTILPKLKTDFGTIIDAVLKKIRFNKFEWSNEKSLCIVLCSKGYPEKYENNIEIKNLEKFIKKMNLFFMLELKTKIKNFF